MEEQVYQQTEGESEPKRLYHYTTYDGLLGILGGKERNIWATHARYLNDASEGKKLQKILLDEIASIRESITPMSYDFGRLVVERITSHHVFITSFCKDGNLLSQWRAYSGNAGGFSIGFNRSHLTEVSKHYLASQPGAVYPCDIPLQECEYCDENSTAQFKTIAEQLAFWFKDSVVSKGKPGPDLDIPKDAREISEEAFKRYWNICKKVPFLKDIGFKEESEWRMAFILSKDFLKSNLKFRCRNSMLIPYLEIGLRLDSSPTGIEQIFVGPCPHPEESREAVEMLLEKEGIRDVKVKDSQIPYRNW